MTPEIERIAREAGLERDASGAFQHVFRGVSNTFINSISTQDLARFAQLIAEECAATAAAMDCAMGCGVGHEVAKAIREKFGA